MIDLIVQDRDAVESEGGGEGGITDAIDGEADLCLMTHLSSPDICWVLLGSETRFPHFCAN